MQLHWTETLLTRPHRPCYHLITYFFYLESDETFMIFLSAKMSIIYYFKTFSNFPLSRHFLLLMPLYSPSSVSVNLKLNVIFLFGKSDKNWGWANSCIFDSGHNQNPMRTKSNHISFKFQLSNFFFTTRVKLFGNFTSETKKLPKSGLFSKSVTAIDDIMFVSQYILMIIVVVMIRWVIRTFLAIYNQYFSV